MSQPGGAPAVQAVGLYRLDDPDWDRFVQAQPFGWVCHLSAWKQVLEESFPHIRGHLLAIRDGGAIRAGLPVYEVTSPVTGKRLVSIPFATLSHPLASSPGDLGALCRAAIEFSRASGSRYLEIRAMSALPGEDVRGFGCADRYRVHWLPVSADLETLLRRLDRSCVRQRIDRSQKAGVELRTAEGLADLERFYGLYVSSRRHLGLPPQPYRFFRALWERLSPSGHLEVHLATARGEALGAILLLRFNGRTSAEYLACDEGRRDLSAGHLLLWDAIRRAHDGGCQVFDFGRTNVANVGLMDFKRRWGTTVAVLPIYYHPPSRARAAEAWRSRLRSTFGATFQRMPEWCSRLLGGVIYRHMG